MFILELIAFVFVMFVMFIPTFIARSRHLARRTACFWLNLFLGWTVIFWVPLIMWALLSNGIDTA
jgi:hypothetical protein